MGGAGQPKMSDALKRSLNRQYGLNINGVQSGAESTGVLGGAIRNIDMRGTQGSRPNLGFTISG